jgi:hypothetical protein
VEPRDDLAQVAMRLRDEQIRAKVVYFSPDQATNAELDAITATVVAELEALQAAGSGAGARPSEAEIEAELSKTLRGFLDTLLSSRRKVFLRRKIEEVQRRITALYFSSELGAKVTDDSLELTEADWPDQALYYAVQLHLPTIVADLYMLKYRDTRVRDEAVERLQHFARTLRVEYLSRTTPELERMLKIFRDALGVFLRQFRVDLGTFCAEVVRESGAVALSTTGYKLPPEAFGPFRQAFERRFIDALVNSVQDDVLQQVPAHREAFRDPTLRFMMDPRVYSEVCAVVCEACYDYLHAEGFLDLPTNWRTSSERA